MSNKPTFSPAANENFEIDPSRSVKLSIDSLVDKAEMIQQHANQAENVRRALRKRLQDMVDALPQAPSETTRDGQDS